MGNAMGFVRMVRSGGLHSTATSVRSVLSDSAVEIDNDLNTVRFVPDLEDIPNFEKLTKDEIESVDAASVLGAIIESLTKHFNSGSKYF